MAENRFVLDTNAVIALAAGDKATVSVLENKLKAADLFISVISEIELFSKPKMAVDEEENLRAFLLERTIIIDLTEDVKNETIALRRSVKLKLPDCIVAATAVVLDSVLLTADKELLRRNWSGLKAQYIF
jgi:predicted nucleic acid-binding protein